MCIALIVVSVVLVVYLNISVLSDLTLTRVVGILVIATPLLRVLNSHLSIGVIT